MPWPQYTFGILDSEPIRRYLVADHIGSEEIIHYINLEIKAAYILPHVYNVLIYSK